MAEQIQNVSLDTIDPPKVAMRSDVRDDGIDELVRSIQAIGIMQPVILMRAGDRYEIIVGHRRVVAARLAGLVLVPAIVRKTTDKEATVLKLHENLVRRDVNPVDEAVFLAQAMKDLELDIAGMVSLTNRSESYISGRLDILEYPDYLIEAIGEKQVSLGAAQWLVKITDERVCRNYVSYAISGGISVKRAIAWFESWRVGSAYSNPLEAKELDEKTGEGRVVHKELCVICQTHDIPGTMMLYYAHLNCVDKIKQ